MLEAALQLSLEGAADAGGSGGFSEASLLRASSVAGAGPRALAAAPRTVRGGGRGLLPLGLPDAHLRDLAAAQGDDFLVALAAASTMSAAAVEAAAAAERAVGAEAARRARAAKAEAARRAQEIDAEAARQMQQRQMLLPVYAPAPLVAGGPLSLAYTSSSSNASQPLPQPPAAPPLSGRAAILSVANSARGMAPLSR